MYKIGKGDKWYLFHSSFDFLSMLIFIWIEQHICYTPED